MQTKNQTDEFEFNPLNLQGQSPALSSSSKKIPGGIGWVGIGAIALCGLCCSLPLLGGGVAVTGAVLLAFLKAAWLWVVLPFLIIGGVLLTRRNKGKTGSCSSSQLSHSCSKQSDNSTTNSACGCGK